VLQSEHCSLHGDKEEESIIRSTISPRRRNRAPSVSVRRRRLIFLITVTLLVVGIAAAWKAYRFWYQPLNPGLVAGTTNTDLNRFSVLVLGADDRPNNPGRSDTMMVSFVDLNAGTIKLLSIPRDSYVKIPNHGWDKINAAYAYGKEQLAKPAVEQLLGIPVDYTITVNMAGFEGIVDAVGGVDINVEADMDYDDPYDDPPLSIHLKQGEQHLAGIDALHYVRFRHDAQSDWGRMKRQQQFLKALLSAAKQPANLTRLPQIISLASANVRTNLSPSQLTRMATLAKDKLSASGMTSETLTGEDIWANEGYFLGINLEDAHSKVREMASITTTPEMLAKDASDAAEYAKHLPVAIAPPTPGTTTTPEDPVTGTTPGSVAVTPKPPVQAESTPSPTPTGWPLVVVDGSNGTQAALLTKLRQQGFILTMSPSSDVTVTMIVAYTAPKEAVARLRGLVPTAKYVSMTPNPGDPPLKLILGPKKA
jgi:LCP family protein required for cell wall assembly